MNKEEAVYLQCILDPGWYREHIIGKPLYPFQLDIIRGIEDHIDRRTGKSITVMMPRQSGKNEVAAEIQKRTYLKYQKEGGVYVRTAPSYKPQVVNSKLRLREAFRDDPLFKTKPQPMEGYIYEYGRVQIQFLSTDIKANVVGATASICLDIDEAHKVDEAKFYEDFAPMAASKSVPILFFGVAATRNDLLYKTRMYNEENDPSLNFRVSVEDVIRYNPSYERHFEEQRKRLGDEHPIIKTQYLLEDIDGGGGLFSDKQRTSILSSDHDILTAPRAGKTYYSTIDVAGEDEFELDELSDMLGGRRDSTVHLIWEIDEDDVHGDFPKCRIVHMYVYIGKKLQAGPDGVDGQQEILLKQLKYWNIQKCCVDARGVGESLASYLYSHHPNVEKYKATAISVSSDIYGLLAMLGNDRIKCYRNNGSVEYHEFVRQIGWCCKEINQGDKIKMVKSTERRHIDMAKAMSFIFRLVDKNNSLFNFRMF